ncbi:MAG: T9SS type A sorting domain-containing protein [Bacteroidetes bacterium]|nr:T9SS type A sorting domain-containing protein [Bacteroidota bacterium]
MKKIFTLIVLFVLFLFHTANAQTPVLSSAPNSMEIKFERPSFSIQKKLSAPLVSPNYSLFLDYDDADAFVWGANNNISAHFMNMHVSTDSIYRYCVVAFDSLYDLSQLDVNGNPPVDWAYKNVTGVTVDTILAVVGQENNSGINDTLRVKIVSVNASGYPTTTVLWSHDTIIPSGTPISPSNDWHVGKVLRFYPNHTLVGSKKFAVQLEYFGAKQDTLVFVAGYQPRSALCPTTKTLAMTTNFSPIGTTLVANSFVYEPHKPINGLIPGNYFSYYDCGTVGTYNQGVDGETYIQNIDIFSYVTITTNTGINEYPSNNGLSLLGAYPNPANDFTNIRYRINEPTTVSVEVFDLTGRVIEQRSEKLSAGTHEMKVSLKDVASGNYFYTIKTGSTQLSSKFIVTHKQ